jgi:dolichol kinase
MDRKQLKDRVDDYQDELLERLLAIEVDAHWFRRVFHTFASCFLAFYLLPEAPWINLIKFVLPVTIIILVGIIEYRRLDGTLDHQYFFGLRSYEHHRPASYFYFGVGLIILLLAFPQQIALPCILCACFIDPAIGEFRHRLQRRTAYLLGFFLSASLFLITWYQAQIWAVVSVSLIGASGAILGERVKSRWLDDDLLIQLLPAILLAILWQGLMMFHVNILPPALLHPLGGF